MCTLHHSVHLLAYLPQDFRLSSIVLASCLYDAHRSFEKHLDENLTTRLPASGAMHAPLFTQDPEHTRIKKHAITGHAITQYVIIDR